MFHQISKYGLKKLDKLVGTGEVVISHVGDGEYSCNTFGNVFSSFSATLKRAKESLSVAVDLYMEDSSKTICLAESREESYESFRGMPVYSRLTIETIDTDFNPGN